MEGGDGMCHLPAIKISFSGGSVLDVDCCGPRGSGSSNDGEGFVRFCGPTKWDDINGPAG